MEKKEKRNLRQEIVDVSKRLFFEYGFNNTSISDIAEELNTSKGHINYYYNSKDEIGIIVYTEFLDKIRKVVHEKLTNKFGGYDSAIELAVRLRVTNKFYMLYPQAFKLYEDLSQKTSYFATSRGHENLNDLFNHFGIHKLKNDGIMDITSYSWTGAASMIILQYFKGNISLSFEEFDDYRVRLPFAFLGIDDAIVDRIVKTSKRLIDELDFEFLPYFDIK